MNCSNDPVGASQMMHCSTGWKSKNPALEMIWNLTPKADMWFTVQISVYCAKKSCSNLGKLIAPPILKHEFVEPWKNGMLCQTMGNHSRMGQLLEGPLKNIQCVTLYLDVL